MSRHTKRAKRLAEKERRAATLTAAPKKLVVRPRPLKRDHNSLSSRTVAPTARTNARRRT